MMSRQQPDGTTLAVRLHGDEYLNFTTTEDGFTITRRADGFYCYARLNDNGQLEPTDHVAHDAAHRSEAERQWLQGVSKCLTPDMTSANAYRQQAEQARQATARAAAQANAPLFDYDNFHGLIILAEFNDRKFSRDDYAQIVNDMVNEENYKGYGLVGNGVFTGSVRDYFYDNSNGTFSPSFDVVGPYTINVSEFYANKTERAPQLTKRVVDAADKDVDFSQYDLDKDGVVDMVYIIFAGYGAQYAGDESKLIWPHASEFYDMTTWSAIYKDNVRLGRYACSTEMLGTPDYGFFDGIGTMCHEFGHVLGLPDLYDTDYEKGGGQSADPGDWTIMAGGGYQNNGRTPSGYTIYERYSLGFATPATLSEEGHYELEAVAESNFGYRLDSKVKKEYFLIENRQKTSKWEKYLPGHGMIVYRVDSTNASVWRSNQVNCNPKHNYFVLVRAGGGNASGGYASDPFPGTKRVTTLNNTTTPANLLTWSGQPSLLGFENIKERNGTISFDLVDVNVLRSISLQETLSLTVGLSFLLEPERTPDYAPYQLAWSTDNPDVCTVDVLGTVTAHKAGQAVITVVANGDEQLTAQCVVTVEEAQLVPDIATYREQDEGAESILSLNNALVVFANDSKVFVRDSSGALCIDVEGLGVETGDLLNGILFGKKTVVNNVPTMVAAGGATNSKGFTIDKGHEVTPRRVALDELSDADRSDLITLTAVTLKRVSNRVWVMGNDEQRIRVYNLLQMDLPSLPKALDGKFFDVTGIYYANKDGSTVIDEIERTEAVVEVADPSGISTVPLDALDAATPATIYTADGRFVSRTTIGRLTTMPLRHGLYIVKTAHGTRHIVR
ncbi:MAG: M6 family metalloprotease domain-containing protein [Prevotella sp.]|nr:M6 family metalloprotease domain-containing protein [Prevotella sp.]